MSAARRILVSLPFAWVAVTAAQLVILFAAGAMHAPPFEQAAKAVAHVIDLFVPYGFWNTANVGNGRLHVASGLAVLACGEYARRRLRLTPSRSVLYDLAVLCIWTVVVEWVIWGRPCSVMIFVDGRGCNPFL